jgi:hypothetical protein
MDKRLQKYYKKTIKTEITVLMTVYILEITYTPAIHKKCSFILYKKENKNDLITLKVKRDYYDVMTSIQRLARNITENTKIFLNGEDERRQRQIKLCEIRHYKEQYLKRQTRTFSKPIIEVAFEEIESKEVEHQTNNWYEYLKKNSY